jgi:hypothetical protein
MADKETLQNEMDDYIDTIHAIIGFMNLYRFDDVTRTMKKDVLLFQGRKFWKELDAENYVTPDLGLLSLEKLGVLGEVKKSFPKDETHWMDDFKQLMSYDEDLIGWPSADKKAEQHDIVLLVHLTRGAKVKQYFEERHDKEISFKRPFVLVEFSRSDERNKYYFFRKSFGNLSNSVVDKKLSDGVPIPMQVFAVEYSTVQLYDSMPPLPYLLQLIWTNVVVEKASKDPKFEKLKKNQKVTVELRIDEIVNTLHQGFSFHTLHGTHGEGQIKVPKKEWIISACNE